MCTGKATPRHSLHLRMQIIVRPHLHMPVSNAASASLPASSHPAAPRLAWSNMSCTDANHQPTSWRVHQIPWESGDSLGQAQLASRPAQRSGQEPAAAAAEEEEPAATEGVAHLSSCNGVGCCGFAAREATDEGCAWADGHQRPSALQDPLDAPDSGLQSCFSAESTRCT